MSEKNEWDELMPYLKAGYESFLKDKSEVVEPDPVVTTPPVVEEPAPVAPIGTVNVSGATGGEWNAGFSINRNWLNIDDTPANRALLLAGRTLEFGDGTRREVVGYTADYKRLYTEYAGTKLKAIPGAIKVYEAGKSEAPVVVEPVPEIPVPVPSAPKGEVVPLMNFNMSALGHASQVIPGKSPQNYASLKESDFANLNPGKGVIIRLGGTTLRFFKDWSTLELDEAYCDLHDQAFEWAAKYDYRILHDAFHDYGRDNNSLTKNVVGSAAYPEAKYQAALLKVYNRFKHHASMWSLSLMNEPYGMTGWNDIAARTVKFLRANGVKHLLVVPGNNYAGARDFLTSNPGYPLKNDDGTLDVGVIYDVHGYLDNRAEGRFYIPGEMPKADAVTSITAQVAKAKKLYPGIRFIWGETGIPHMEFRMKAKEAIWPDAKKKEFSSAAAKQNITYDQYLATLPDVTWSAEQAEAYRVAQGQLIDTLAELDIPVCIFAVGQGWSTTAVNGLQMSNKYRFPMKELYSLYFDKTVSL